VRAGRSVATTMGLTPLDGVPMATRPGHLDPGVVPYLLRQGLSLEEVEDGLYHRSGWLGVSGRSADMRELLASGDSRARAAVDLFCYRVVCEIGSLAAALGGVEALVFTGGVGENAPRSAPASWRAAPGWGFVSTRPPTPATAPASPSPTAPPPGWSPPTRRRSSPAGPWNCCKERNVMNRQTVEATPLSQDELVALRPLKPRP